MVFLIRPEFRAGWLVDGVPRNDFPLSVDPARDFIDTSFWEVRNHGESTAHVAINRAIAHGEFALVTGGEKQVIIFVR